MSKPQLTKEEEQAFRREIGMRDQNIARYEIEVRSAQAKLKAEVLMRASLVEQLGGSISSTDDRIKYRVKLGSVADSEQGLSETIRAIVREMGHFTKAPPVANELKRRNFPYTASTPLVTRVGNEMRRMARSGVLVRRGKKYGFAAAKANGADSSEEASSSSA
jgi:hypothetical protein